jgi:hypothetical protein
MVLGDPPRKDSGSPPERVKGPEGYKVLLRSAGLLERLLEASWRC